MVVAEFQTELIDGNIPVPPSVREQFPGRVHVIVFAAGAEQDTSSWPEANRRRWELLAKMSREVLSSVETQELIALQRLADEKLSQVGPRPTEHLERLYAELTQGS